MKLTLTDRFISTVKPTTSQVDYFDSKTRGLVLRVAPNGVRSWCLFFTAPRDRKRARFTLGRYPQTSLADARTRAVEAKALIDQGTDPRDAACGPMTVSNLVDGYLVKVAALRSAKGIGQKLKKNVVTIIGGLALAELHRRDIHRVLDPVLARGKRQEALAVFKHCRALFAWAVERGYLDVSPVHGVKAPAEGSIRDRVLSDSELVAAWNADTPIQPIIRLCMLTAQRVGEVAGMRSEEIDLNARTWTIPVARSKNRHAHTVPLTDAALALIPRTKGPLFDAGNSACIGKALTRASLGDWTMHDIRRSAVSGMAALGVAPIVLGHVINHRSVTKAGVTLQVYSKYDYGREKREALDLWADRLAAIVDGHDSATVIPLYGAP